MREIGLVDPADCSVAAIDELLGVRAEVGSRSEDVGHWAFFNIRSASDTRISPDSRFGSSEVFAVGEIMVSAFVGNGAAWWCLWGSR